MITAPWKTENRGKLKDGKKEGGDERPPFGDPLRQEPEKNTAMLNSMST
jgi:hypothetical protein